MNKNLNNNTTTFVSKLTINGKKTYARILWKQNEHDLFHIQIYDDEITWKGRFSNLFAKSCREGINQTEEIYNQNVMNALTGESEIFTYDIFPDQGNKKVNIFQWHMHFEDGASLIHGCMPVHQEDTPHSKDELIEVLLLQNKTLRDTIETLTKTNVQIEQELDQCKDEVEKFVNIKTCLESSLYGKFVQLLNAKKHRIQLLEENLHKVDKPGKTSCENELD